MKLKLCMFAIYRTATSLQRTNNLNPRTRWYPVLDESNWMKSTYFTIHPGKNPPQNGCRLHIFHILHFPNSTGLFTKPTGRHYTKYRFSPNIVPLLDGCGHASKVPLYALFHPQPCSHYRVTYRDLQDVVSILLGFSGLPKWRYVLTSGKVCGCHLVRSSCSPTYTNKIYTTKYVLHQQIYDETFAKKQIE